MLEHPYPVGTRVELTHPSKYKYYRVLRSVRGSNNDVDSWYYQVCAEEWWETEGIEETKYGQSFPGAGQIEANIRLAPPEAMETYETLRQKDP